MHANLLARSHPRGSGVAVQLALLTTAAMVGCLLGLALLAADAASWHGASTARATVVGRSTKGVLARTPTREVVLHLARIPAVGRTLAVQVTADGRARPLSYRQTPAGSLRTGILTAVGLGALLQGYRFAVTRRPAAGQRH